MTSSPLTAHIAAVSRSGRFTLYNIRKIRRYLSEHSTQLLVQGFFPFKLDYCNSLLAACLPACTTRPLQRIQKAAARLVYNLPRHSHVTLLISLHGLPVMARFRFKKCMVWTPHTVAGRTCAPSSQAPPPVVQLHVVP